MSGPLTVEIVSADNTSYLEWIERCIRFEKELETKPQKDPVAADYNESMRELEAATLLLLGKSFGVQIGCVLKVARWKAHYRLGPYDFHQLDALTWSGGAPVFCEVKHTFTPRQALQAARKQVRKRVGLASEKWSECRGVVLCFHLSNEDEANGTPPDRYRPLEDLGKLLATKERDGDIPCILVAGTELRLLLDRHGLDGTALMSNLAKAKGLLDSAANWKGSAFSPLPNSFGDAMDRVRKQGGR